MFLRKPSGPPRDPLAVTMTGVRMGERLLQIGAGDAAIVGLLAAKPGLSGHAAAIVADGRSAAHVRRATEDRGGLMDVTVAPYAQFPFEAGSFDVAIVHGAAGLLPALDAAERASLLREAFRVLRSGGRIVVIEAGERTGLRAWFSPSPASDARYEAEGGTPGALERAGFRPVRLLADREGLKFVEGLRP